MRIAMIGQKGIPATYGGVERHVEEVARGLAEMGHEVSVYCRPHYTPKSAVVLGVRLVFLPSIPTKHLDAITHVILCAIHVLGTRAQIVHFHALGPASMAWLPRLAGKKTVVTVHGLDWRREKWGRAASAFLRACERAATRFPEATIVVSQTLAKHFQGRGSRVHYIPNGTPLPSPAPETEIRRLGLTSGEYILFVGRLVPEKGVHVLAEAHHAVPTKWPLVIAGEGHFTDNYVAECRRIAGPEARFLGAVYGETLASLWQHAGLVVLPSSMEGLSIALLEAMSFGRPVIASGIPENEEVLEGIGETFAPGNVAALASAMTRLLSAPEERRIMGEKGRERIAERYGWGHVVQETANLYQDLLGQGFNAEEPSRTSD